MTVVLTSKKVVCPLASVVFEVDERPEVCIRSPAKAFKSEFSMYFMEVFFWPPNKFG